MLLQDLTPKYAPTPEGQTVVNWASTLYQKPTLRDIRDAAKDWWEKMRDTWNQPPIPPGPCMMGCHPGKPKEPAKPCH